MKRLEKKHGQLPETYTVQTPRGGRHYYFQTPDALPIKSRSDVLAVGIDVRGDGGYVVAPGSTVGGKPYRVLNATPPAMPPQWLVEAVRKENAAPPAVNRTPPSPTPQADETEIRDALKSVSADLNYDDWLHVGMALHHWNTERGLSLWHDWSATCAEKYDAATLDKKWNSFGGSSGAVTIKTVFHMAQKAGWKPQAANLQIAKRGSVAAECPAPEELTPETAFTEFEFATLLAAQLPPIKTIGENWHAFERGAWYPVEAFTFKPQALAILPEHNRTVRRAVTLLDHIGAAQQVAPDSFKGFYSYDPDGAVLINTANGVCRVTANSVDILPHSAGHNFTRQTVAQFNPDATAPLFQRILREALPDPEDRELFKLCLGNILLPDCRFETALVCYGEAGRGKSTVADPVSAALGVSLVSRCSMSQICDPKSYHLPGLRFSAVNLGTELTTADIAESGNFKTIVSGEPIEARSIFGKPFVMQTASKLWFLANSLPRFKHGTEAELRRTRFLRFDYQPPQKDVTLKTRLAAELDGVFLYMLDGLRELLSLPQIPLGGKESRAVHERFQISNDPVGAFVQSRCVLDPEARVSKDTLREAYAEFTIRHELPAVCAEWFFRVLYERFTSLKETQPRVAGERVRHVQGVQLRSTVSLESE